MPTREGGRGEREARLARVLEQVRAECDVAVRRDADPVGIVHRYADPLDRELVALAASSLAFGNVKTIRAKLGDALERIGPSPAKAADAPAALVASLRGWVHRVYRGEDLAGLLAGARKVQRKANSLGAFFRAELDRARANAAGAESDEDVLRRALTAFTEAIRRAGKLEELAKRTGRRGPLHLLPDPSGTSGSKRLLLFLRWMVRPADGIDLGQWPVPAKVLLVPVDVHIHKVARNLGFTRRTNLSWKTTVEITRALARFDPHDPVKYDFSLCHMGMVGDCPSRRDPVRCEGCGVRPVCRHWDQPAPTPRGPARPSVPPRTVRSSKPGGLRERGAGRGHGRAARRARGDGSA